MKLKLPSPSAHSDEASRTEASQPRSGDGLPLCCQKRPSKHLKRLLTAVPLAALLFLGCRSISRFRENNQSPEARKYSREGVQAMNAGDWETAEEKFLDALTLSDADDRAYRGLSEAHWNRGEKDKAIRYMEKAVKLSAGDPRLVGRLGEMYLDNGRIEDAHRQSEIALAAERYSPQIWTLRGDCLRESGKNAASLAAYHRALALQPDFVDAKIRVAELYLNEDQYDRLLATLDQIDPSGDEADIPSRIHMLRGLAMKNLNRPELAAKHFYKAAQADPKLADPHLQVAAIQLENGREDLARDSVDKAMRLDPALVRESGWSKYLSNPEQWIAEDSDSTSTLK